MTQIFARIAAAMSLLAFAVAVPTGAASAQGAKELLGAWTIVSITVEGDGKKSEPFGPNPGGTQTYDSNGRFASMALRSDLPKIASNNRGTATLEESQKIVHGSMAYYGSYTINEAEKSITMQMEGATFPNWVGTTHKRLFAISGDTALSDCCAATPAPFRLMQFPAVIASQVSNVELRTASINDEYPRYEIDFLFSRRFQRYAVCRSRIGSIASNGDRSV